MEIARLSTRLTSLGAVAQLVNAESVPTVVHVEDADSVIAVASMKDELRKSIGIWLEVSSSYPASLAARDVKTLSWLVELSDVVVSGEHASSHARVLKALLSDDEVNISTDVAVITKAFNRPAPPHSIRVWHLEGTTLVCGEQISPMSAVRRTDAGEITYFG